MRRAPIALAVLLAAAPGAAQSVRAPYLQQGTPDSMTIAWRTAAPEGSAVCVGASPDALTRRVAGEGAVLDHAVRVGGLARRARARARPSARGWSETRGRAARGSGPSTTA